MFSIVFGDPFTLERKKEFFNDVSLWDAIKTKSFNDGDSASIMYLDEDKTPKEITPDLAKYTKPKKGEFFVYIKPQDSDTARIALTIALVATGQFYAAAYFTGATLAVVNAGIVLGSTYLASALIPYEDTSIKPDSTESSTLSISGASNSIKQGAPVPHLVGTHKFTPPKSMQPIFDAQGKTVTLTEVFCLGIGPMIVDIDNIEINDTKIAEYDDVEVQIKDNYNNTAPISFVQGDVNSETVSATFSDGGDEAIRTTSTNTEQISVEIAFPSLVKYNDKGQRTSTSCNYSILYKKSTDPDTAYISFTGSSANAENLTFSSVGTRLSIKDREAGRDDRQVYKFVTGVESYITFNDGMPSGFATGTTFTVAGSVENSGVYTIQSVSSNTVKVGDYTIENSSPTSQYIKQSGRQVSSESGSDAYVSIGGGTDNTFTATDSTATTTYRTHTVNVEKGQYDVKVVRNTAAPSDTKTSNSFNWTQLKSTQLTDSNGDPIKAFPDDLCYVGVKIKATDQLNGSISNLTVKATSYVPKYDLDAGEFIDENGSGNPAWEYLNVLTNQQAKVITYEDGIDLEEIVEWAELCDELVANSDGDLEPRFRTNFYMDYTTKTRDLLSKIASVGRASRRKLDSKESIVIDKAGKQPVMFLSQANISEFRWSKSFVKQPDAVLLTFNNEDEDYEVTELLVKKDNSVAEEDLEYIEELDASGITDPDQVYRFGKFAIAQIIQRPETYTIKLGINFLQFIRGDVVGITHDKIQGVTCVGQVLSSSGLDVVVDNPFNISNDELPLYCVFSNPETYEQTIATYEINNIDGSVLTFNSLPAFDLTNANYAISDSVESITRLYVVKNIITADDITATIECVDYAEDTIFEAEDDVSDYVAGIKDLTINRSATPVTPIVDSIVTDESVIRIRADGTMEVRAKINLEEPSNNNRPEPEFVEILFRPNGTDAIYKKLIYRVGEEYYITDIEEAENYDIKVRYISIYGIASSYVSVNDIEIIGKTSPPPDISSINYSQGSISWSYPNEPIDFAGFEVRYASGSLASWETATPLHDGLITQSKYDISPFVSSINTFFVKAVDTTGNFSINSAKVIVNLGDYDASNIITTINKYTEEWPDEIVNGYVDGVTGFLCSETASFYQADGNSIFYSLNGSSEFYSDKYKRMEYIFEYTPDPIDEGANLFVEFESSVDGTTLQWIEPDNSLFYDGANNSFYGESEDRFYSDYEETYTAFSGAILGMGVTTYKIKVIVPENQEETSCLEYVKILVDVEDVEEKIDDFALLTGQGRIPLTKSFRSIRNLQITLQDQDASAFKAVIGDKDELLGPLIKVYDIDNNLTQATVDVLVRGY